MKLAPSTARELASLNPLVETPTYQLFLIRGDQCPETLLELGRARETTFQQVGQGAGRRIDLSPEDQYYHHLILWHPESRTLAGAYRLGIVDPILHEFGPRGLYLGQVFEIDPAFYQHLAPAIELSRSFVLPTFQRDNQALALLWKGLGLAATHFGARTLYGSVTMGSNFSKPSRAAAVRYLQANHRDDDSMCRLIRARQPFDTSAQPGSCPASLKELADQVSRHEGGERKLPPLMRYYCQLGARFLAFHTEASFGDALFCLLRVDLEKIPPAYRRRFL